MHPTDKEPKLLIVDDDTDFLAGMRRMLRKHAHHWIIAEAITVDDAIQTIKSDPPDTIVCDVKMPFKDGFDLLQWQQQHEHFRNIPFVMLTGVNDNSLKLRALNMGATDLLNKPVFYGDLLARITSCLRLKSYHDEINEQKRTLEEKVRERTQQALLAAEVSNILVQKHNFQEQLQDCTDAIVKHLDAALARLWLLDDETQTPTPVVSSGMSATVDGPHQAVPIDNLLIGRIARDATPHLTNNVLSDPPITDREWVNREEIAAFAGYPLIANGIPVGVVAIFSKKPINDSVVKTLASISDELALFIKNRKSLQELHFLTFYDSLTNLPNRTLFFDFMHKEVTGARQANEKAALLLINIDNFSRINNSLGHEAGDACLVELSHRLRRTFRHSDAPEPTAPDQPLIARMGGDHFLVLLTQVFSIGTVSSIARKVLETLSAVFEIAGHQIFPGASIGIAVSPDDGDNAGSLLQNAEAALAHVKQKGKNNFGFYSKFMNDTAVALLDLDSAMREALEQKAFQVYYQPKMNIVTKRLVGMEALIRWQKEDGSLVSPAEFIPLAEENGQIVPIGAFVLETACMQNKTWHNDDMAKICVAVNVSARQFAQEDFVQSVLSVLQSSGLPAEYLELEITETLVMANPSHVISSLNELKKHGIRISLDDFGTGYSSLAYLQKLPIDIVKIDLSFVRNILTNPQDAAIVKTIIDMSHNLGLEAIAEGVETKEQLELLHHLGCDVAQGYLFSRPVPAGDFEIFLKQHMNL